MRKSAGAKRKQNQARRKVKLSDSQERKPPIGKRKRFVLGDMIGTVQIVGDIVSPIIDLEELEAYRDKP
jgi:hypothetical protein